MSKDKILKEFQDPPVKWRSAPFWSWNDRLQPEELVRQVKDMKEHGMGGFFMHSREGLETEYLSEEWMNCIRETVKAAEESGMEAWLYDEDRWPSGFAGGLVPGAGDDFRAKFVELSVYKDEVELDGEELAVYEGSLAGDKLESLERLERKAGRLEPEAGGVLLVARVCICPKSEWFNDDTYSDNMNPEAVQLFIKTTYEKYKEEVGQHFGKAIPGIFTDEPNISAWRVAGDSKYGAPWSLDFEKVFAEKRGYDLLDVLPYLFFEGEPAPKTRHDFWRTVTERFVEAFSKQLGEWCEKQGIALTGHYLAEQSLASQIRVGGAVMPHYAYQQAPGIDILSESIRENLTVKQCSSVAHQFERNVVLSETYGCSGWEFTFLGQKWVGDWQYALGITKRCQHLALYTLRGCRKRDYPPCFNYNTTWWKYNKVVEDYFGRLGVALTSGKPVQDVLLIHPVTSAWAAYKTNDPSAVRKLDENLEKTLKVLLGSHYDFDLGDELIMSKWGKVEDGRFKVNQASYRMVVLPPMTSMLQSTLSLLEEWLDAGGHVIAVAPSPTMVEGEQSEKLQKLRKHKNWTEVPGCEELPATLEGKLPRRISIRGHNGLEDEAFIYQQRDFGDMQVYFIVNLDRESAHEVEIELPVSGFAERWCALTGKKEALATREIPGGQVITRSFAPAESMLLVVHKEAQVPEGTSGQSSATGARPVAYIGPKTTFRRSDPNVLTQDRCRFRMNEGKWSEPVPVWMAQSRIRRELGMRSIDINGQPQRYRWIYEPHERNGTPVELEFTFQVESVPQTPVYLVVEGSRQYEIRLNGERVPNKPDGWYLDRSFDRVPLPRLKEGTNTLTLSIGYRNSTEIEDCYLIGDFGVKMPERVITEEPSWLQFGDWCLQGYPHYAGSMIYESEVELAEGGRYFLRLGDHSAILVAVWVNNHLAGFIPWPDANPLEITEYVQPGANKISIEVVSGPRNMLGPLHRKAGYEPWTDSRSFRTTGEAYTPDYVLQPYGLQGQVAILRK